MSLQKSPTHVSGGGEGPPPDSSRSRIGDLEGRQVLLVPGSGQGTNGERADWSG